MAVDDPAEEPDSSKGNAKPLHQSAQEASPAVIPVTLKVGVRCLATLKVEVRCLAGGTRTLDAHGCVCTVSVYTHSHMQDPHDTFTLIRVNGRNHQRGEYI